MEGGRLRAVGPGGRGECRRVLRRQWLSYQGLDVRDELESAGLKGGGRGVRFMGQEGRECLDS